MKIVLNGRDKITNSSSLEDLILEEELKREGLVILVGDRIIEKDLWRNNILNWFRLAITIGWS